MYQRTKSELMVVTPEKAVDFLKLNDFSTQRRLRPAHVTELAEKMKRGIFRHGNVAVANTSWNTRHLMDGQHCCTAIAHTGIPQECVVEEFSVPTMVGLSLLFKQFDQLSRSFSDVIRVEKDALGIQWPDRIASLIISAAAILEGKEKKFHNSSKFTREEKTNFLKQYIEEGNFLNKIFLEGGGDSWKLLRRAPVVAAIVLTMRKSKSDAGIFWAKVRDGENLTRKMPEWTLRNFYMTHFLYDGRSGKVYNKANNHEFVYKSILAWNAFREGRELTILKYNPENSVPKVK